MSLTCQDVMNEHLDLVLYMQRHYIIRIASEVGYTFTH